MKDSSDLAHLCCRIGRHEDITSSRESAGSAFYGVCDESTELVIRNLGSSGGKYRNWTRINYPLHALNRATKWQLYHIGSEVDGQRGRVKQGFQWWMVLNSRATRIDHGQ